MRAVFTRVKKSLRNLFLHPSFDNQDIYFWDLYLGLKVRQCTKVRIANPIIKSHSFSSLLPELFIVLLCHSYEIYDFDFSFSTISVHPGFVNLDLQRKSYNPFASNYQVRHGVLFHYPASSIFIFANRTLLDRVFVEPQ
jgi:hypothetical protein